MKEMGHANVSVTLDVYTHLDFTQIQEKMTAGFSQKVQKEYKIQICKSIDTPKSPILSAYHKKFT